MTLLRSVLFTTLLFVSVVPWSIVVVVGRLAGARASYALVLVWTRAIFALLQRLCGLGYVVEGRENLPDEPCVVMLKHSSAFETLAQLLVFPRQTWVLKRELMWAPFLGWALATLGPIAIDRGAGRSAVQQVLAQGRRRLDAGFWVMIFPEGTRMPPGETRRYGMSGSLLAIDTGRPIVPVAHDAGDFWPRRGWRKRPGQVRFSIGPPIRPDGRDPRALNEAVQTWIEGRVAELRAGR